MLTLKINGRILLIGVVLALLLAAAQLLWGQAIHTTPPNSLQGYEILTSSTPSDTINYKQISLSCPPGKIILSGGAGIFHDSASKPDSIPRLVSSFMYPDENSWYAEAAQPQNAIGTWSLQVQVICVDGAPNT